MRRIASALLALLGAISIIPASTTVWMRTGSPFATQIVSPGCTNATPMVCTVVSVSGLAAGDTISVAGVCAADGANNVSAAYGVRKIGAIVGSTISLQDNDGTPGLPDGTPIAGNGVWCAGTANGWASGIQSVGKLTLVTLADGPRGAIFDGWTGTVTRRWATGLHNGLVSIIVASNVATVTYSYAHGLATSDKIKIWNTANSTFTPAGGREFTVASTPTPAAYTFAVTIADGDYTSNPVCGPGASPDGTIKGTEECVRISAGATSANRWWPGALSRNPTPASGNYRFAFQAAGAPQTGENYSIGPAGVAEIYAEYFALDQTASAYLTAALDILNHIELMSGPNIYGNPEALDLGHYDLSEQVSNQLTQASTAYAWVGGYFTAAERAAFLGKMQNDVTDPGGCTKSIPARTAFTSGTARAGSSTTIQLATGASAVDGTYVNAVVDVTLIATGNRVVGLVASYVGATRTATVTDWRNVGGGVGVSPALNDTYNVWATSSLSGTTLTGYGTTWNSVGVDQVHVGDYMISMNLWLLALSVGRLGYVVTAVNSDTSLTVILAQNGYGTATTTPEVSWIGDQWATGNCGFQWVQNAFPGGFGSQPKIYPVRGGYDTHNYGSNIASGLAAFQLSTQLALADDSASARTNLARWSQAGVDYSLALAANYGAGVFYSGESYNTTRAEQAFYGIAWTLSKSISSFPALDLTGPWVTGYQQWKQYGLHPDAYQYPLTGTAFGLYPNTVSMALDYGIGFDRTTTASKYTQYLLDNTLALTSGLVGQLPELAIRLDPRVLTLDYRNQPLQYLFSATSRDPVSLSFGFPFPAAWRGDAFISRTGWTHNYDTLVWYGARAYVGDHDTQVQPGDLQVYSGGTFFLANDDIPPGDLNNSLKGPYLQFGATTTYKGSYDTNGPATPLITRWSGGVPYGDPASAYACAASNLAGAYTTALTRAERTICHFKKAGREQIIVEYTDVVSPSPIILRDQLYYTENGEAAQSIAGVVVTAPEGTTSYPGSGGCGSLDTNRTVLSQQDGLSTGGPTPLPGTSAPLRQYNFISKFLSPGTITLNCDGTGYSGATGHAERVSIYGGSSVGGTSTTLESVMVHKIATQPDTSLTAGLLNAGSTWAAVETTDTVSLFARGGNLNNSASFTSTHSGTASYVVNGLTPSTYTVKKDGVVVSGSPFIVPAANNSLQFESAAGAISVEIGGAFNVGTIPSSKGASSAKIPR